MRNFFVGLLRLLFTLITFSMTAMFIGFTIIFLIAISELPVIGITAGVGLVLLTTSCMSAIWFYLSLNMVNAAVASKEYERMKQKQKAAYERRRL